MLSRSLISQNCLLSSQFSWFSPINNRDSDTCSAISAFCVQIVCKEVLIYHILQIFPAPMTKAMNLWYSVALISLPAQAHGQSVNNAHVQQLSDPSSYLTVTGNQLFGQLFDSSALGDNWSYCSKWEILERWLNCSLLPTHSFWMVKRT